MNARTIAEPSRIGRPPTNQLAVFDLLVHKGKPMTLNEIADSLQFKHFLAREAIENLVERKVVAGCTAGAGTREKVYFPIDAFRAEWQGVTAGEMEKIRANVQFAVDRAEAEVHAASKKKREALAWLKRIEANIEVRKLAAEGVRHVGS